MRQSLKPKGQKLIKENRTILLIVALGLAMRLVVINQSLWLDEAIGALAVRDFSYFRILTNFLKFDNHPPLYYLTLKAWTDIFGYSELALRSLSIVFGLGTILLTYKIAQKLTSGNSFFSILSALLMATSQFHIYYSQEARMYSMAAFFASLAINSFLFISKKLGSDRVRPCHWWVFSSAITALVFTDYVPIFLLPVFWIYAVYKKKDKSWWKKFLLSHLPVVVFGFLWLPTFLIQAEKGRWLVATLPGWTRVAGGATFKQAALVWMKFVLGRISLRNKILYYGLVILASIPFLPSLAIALKQRKKIFLVLMWLVVPLVLGFLASFWFPAFIYFRFLYVVPAFYLLTAWGVSNIRNLKLRNVLVVCLIFVNIVGWLIYVSNPSQQRESWRQVVGFIEENASESDVAVFEYPKPFSPFRWYAKGLVEAVGVTDSISANPQKTTEKTEFAIRDKSGVYYFEYLRDLSDPERIVEKTLKGSGFVETNVYDHFPGIGQITYWVKK